jgi:hypothetical protein
MNPIVIALVVTVGAAFVVFLLGFLHLRKSVGKAEEEIRSPRIEQVPELAQECARVFRDKLGQPLSLEDVEASAAALDDALRRDRIGGRERPGSTKGRQIIDQDAGIAGEGVGTLRTKRFAVVVGITWVLIAGGTTVMGAEGAKLDNLEQPPLNTTMMGVLKGVADYYGLDLTAPTVYGMSGHAFLINIHVELCPSGPYCWKREKADPLIENMGLKMTDLGFFGTGAKEDARTDVEQTLREALDKGVPCSLINMENQIIDGYDETGFFSAQPWAPHNDFPPARLSFGSWKEFGDEFHVNFYTIRKVKPADRRDAILASLDYAVDMWRHPAEYSSDSYGAGSRAYDNWIRAVPGAGSSHGNWWNATVWSECREMAARYFTEIGKAHPPVAGLCSQLADEYRKISDHLERISDKEMDPDEKISLLKQTKEMEKAAVGKVEQLAKALRGNPGDQATQNQPDTGDPQQRPPGSP